MKKQMMLAVIGACCAVRAASFTWGSDDTINELNAGEGGYVSEGTTYYLFAVGSTTDAITSFDGNSHQIKIGDTTYDAVDSHVIDSDNYTAGTFGDVYTADASSINQNYYVVLFDADTPTVAGSGLFTASGITETSTPPNYTAAIDGTGIGTAANMATPVTSGGGAPEPTSGLLLLVGAGLLGLRRKRA